MNLGPVHADLMLKRATNLATGGRWYPTLVTMPNGSVLAMGGRPGADDARRTNTTMEVFNGVAWDRIGPDFDDESSAVVQYPRLHAMPGGYVFRSFPPRPAPAADSKTVAFATGQWFCVGAPVPAESYGHSPKRIDERPAGLYREYAGASVLLPLLPEERYRPRVLVCGGRRAFIIDLGDYTPGDASQACDPSSQAIGPSWRTTSARRLRLPNPLTGVPYSPERRGCNAVLLPTGHVFVCGGVEGTYDAGGTFMRHNDDAVLEAEQYDPVSDTWEVLERAHVVRNYHSVSLLMPDGRIWTAGSNENCDQGKSELRIEIYEPWYFGRPDRPEITRVIHRHRNTLSIETPQASSVQRVAMIRAGSVTHAFNSDQRYIGLRFSRGDGVLSAQIPSSDIAIPGYYLLFLIDHSVPSKGTFIHVSPTNFQAPTAGVLFWLLGGTLGVLPSGRGQRVPPGDPPFRDMLLGLAAYELGRHIEDPEERAAVQKVGLNLVSNIAQKTLRAI